VSFITRVRTRTVAVLVAIGMVAGAGGARAATSSSTADAWQTSPAVHTVIDQLIAIEQSPDFAAFAAAHPALTGGRFAATGDARVDGVSTRFNDLLASSAWTTTASLLGARLATTAPADLSQALYWIGQGNAQAVGIVGLWTVLIVPETLRCPIGDPTCEVFWVLIGASLSAVGAETAAFDYLNAVMALA